MTDDVNELALQLYLALVTFSLHLWRRLIKPILMAICIGLGIVAVLQVTPFGRDDSDQKGWFAPRSGMVPLTDHGTGCQYLRSTQGHLTPRLDAKGSHICTKE